MPTRKEYVLRRGHLRGPKRIAVDRKGYPIAILAAGEDCIPALAAPTGGVSALAAPSCRRPLGRSFAFVPLLAHGRLPQTPFEWVMFVVAGVVGAWVIWKAVRYTLKPGETEPDHVKRSILNDPTDPPPAPPPDTESHPAPDRP